MKLFDLHCDTLYECYTQQLPLLDNELHIDLTRGLRYDAWVQAFAVWMPDTLRGEEAFDQCRSILQLAHRQAEQNPEHLRLVNSVDDLRESVARHVCGGILTIEGGSALAGRLEALDDFANLGVKMMTLTWNGSNELGHGSRSGSDEGLTPFGIAAVRRMEQLHILPDVSHLNERGFWDVISNATGPVIASHSLSGAMHSHPRNLTDAQFVAIRDSGGLVGLNLCGDFLGEQSFEYLARHLDHFLSLGGENTLAFGCDLDGATMPPEWKGIEVMQMLYDYLLKAGNQYKEEFLDRLFFGNCYDFFERRLSCFDKQASNEVV